MNTRTEGERSVGDALEQVVDIPVGEVVLEGELIVPAGARGIVIFAHGSGSSRKSPRNNFVAEEIHERGAGTLLFDLLTEEEDRVRQNRFDISLLTWRLLEATRWVQQHEGTKSLTLGYFGSSTGAASALLAAAEMGESIRAVVSRGGRVDMAAEELDRVRAPTLLVVGGRDTQVLHLNQDVFERLEVEKSLHVVEGATHLFEEPGALEEVAAVAADWFRDHFSS